MVPRCSKSFPLQLYLARSWFNNGTPSDTELRTLADTPRPQLDPWKFPRLKRFYLPGPHMEPPVMQGIGGCGRRVMKNQQTAVAISSEFLLVVTVARCCKVGFVPCNCLHEVSKTVRRNDAFDCAMQVFCGRGNWAENHRQEWGLSSRSPLTFACKVCYVKVTPGMPHESKKNFFASSPWTGIGVSLPIFRHSHVADYSFRYKRESGDAATKRQPWLDWRTRLGNLWRFNCPKAPAFADAVEKEMGTSDDEKYDAWWMKLIVLEIKRTSWWWWWRWWRWRRWRWRWPRRWRRSFCRACRFCQQEIGGFCGGLANDYRRRWQFWRSDWISDALTAKLGPAFDINEF